ncbi:unnamed protein product [Boreogadus saida]
MRGGINRSLLPRCIKPEVAPVFPSPAETMSPSCRVEISNSSSSDLSDPEIFQPKQCSLPLSPLLKPGSVGGASFNGSGGGSLNCLFIYHLHEIRAMLVVWFKVRTESEYGCSNDFAVAIYDPTECDHELLKRLTEGSEEGLLKASKASFSRSSFVVRATMSDIIQSHAVLKVDVSNVPLPNAGAKHFY